jgi:hypothetical protein
MQPVSGRQANVRAFAQSHRRRRIRAPRCATRPHAQRCIATHADRRLPITDACIRAAVRWKRREWQQWAAFMMLWLLGHAVAPVSPPASACHAMRCAAASRQAAHAPEHSLRRRRTRQRVRRSRAAIATQRRDIPVQMWQGWAQSRCRCGRGGPSADADVATGTGPVPVQMWQRWAQC